MLPALYIHVPYCEKKCSYCAFNSAAGRSVEEQEKYVQAVLLELDHAVTKHGNAVSTIYIGGGTPSALPGNLFHSLLTGVQQRLDLRQLKEWTVEINPGTLTQEHLATLQSSKVDRVSMGVQSLDPQRLEQLGRVHSVEQVHQSVQQLRASGIQRINLDLIYAQPEQSLEAWEQDVDKLLQLQPQHISAYALQYEEGTPLTRELEAGRLKESPEELTRSMFESLEAKLAAAGYGLYEISNFAQQNEESHHNQHYWLNLEYHGLGAGAWGRLGQQRTRNVCSPAQYIRRITERGEAVEEVDTLGPAEDWMECLTSGLRTTRGVDLRSLRERTGIDTQQAAATVLDEIQRLALGSCEGEQLRLSRDGMWVLDSILSRFLDYVPRSA